MIFLLAFFVQALEIKDSGRTIYPSTGSPGILSHPISIDKTELKFEKCFPMAEKSKIEQELKNKSGHQSRFYLNALSKKHTSNPVLSYPQAQEQRLLLFPDVAEV